VVEAVNRVRRGFTLLEVLGSVLVLSLGFSAAIGMLLYGFHLSKLSLARTTALATAMSAAVDPTPLGSGWTAAVPGTTKGYLNGYYVERTESAPVGLATGLSVAHVTVDVYETAKGRLVASYDQRLVKK
jgi:prepilin-type N-terminal cleavage/methylation domain-containing protein